MITNDWILALNILPLGIVKSFYMVIAAALFGTLIGLPLGVILTITERGHIKEHALINKWLGLIINILRSFPFAILIIALIPFTRLLIGTSLGTTAAIVPLSIAAAPFLARLFQTALSSVDKQIIDAAIVMGSTTRQIIYKVLFNEALPSLIDSLTLTLVNLIGYSALAGLVGGGGLGQIAIQYGYQRFNGLIMLLTVLLLILIVQLIQWGGAALSRHIYTERGIYRA